MVTTCKGGGHVVSYTIIRTETEFLKLLADLKQVDRWAMDTEGRIGIYPDYGIAGISISLDGEHGYYIPVAHSDGSGQLPADYVVSMLKPFIESNERTLYMHNYKHDAKAFRVIDPTLEFNEEKAFCTMTASFILNVNNEHGLKESILREFSHKMTTLDEVKCPKKKDRNTKDVQYFPEQMEVTALAEYASDDAIQTYRLGELYARKIEEQGYSKVFYELEMPFMLILMELEENGIMLDKENLVKFMEDAPNKLGNLNKEIQEALPVKDEVNLNSSQQLNELLFKKLKIKPRGEKLKSGVYSVTNTYLDLWGADNVICGKIAEYRRLVKLFGNYLSNLYYRISPSERIHCNFNRHVAKTGRLSSSKTNLQNIPRPENDVYGLRKLFIAPEGKSLIVADYSQIELVVLAHLSKDPVLMKAFIDGNDIHSATAKEVFKIDASPEEIKKDKDKYGVKRSVGKCVSGDTRIFTSKGLLRIEDICDFRSVDKFVTLSEDLMSSNGVATTSYFYYGGVQDTITICTLHGYSITGTPNHRVLVRDTKRGTDVSNLKCVTWKCLSDITTDDYVYIHLTQDTVFPDKYVTFRHNLWTTSAHTGSSLPIIEIDENWGFLIGYLLGDGSISEKAVTLTIGEVYYGDLIDNISKAIASIGLNMHVSKYVRKPNKPIYTLVLGSRRLIRFLRDVGICKSADQGGKLLKVPECIFRSPKKVVCSFLRGIFESDGWVTTSGSHGLAMCTMSLSFAQEIQLLLTAMGIRNSINIKYNKVYDRDYYDVYVHKASLPLFNELIGFVSKQKQSKLDYVCASIQHSNMHRVHLPKVSSITKGRTEVFDFTVPETHNFVGNGMINHNTLNFGMVYEAGCKTLTATANKDIKNEADRLTEAEMKSIMEAYFRRYKGVETYIQQCHKNAMKNGFVSTITGRRRLLPDAQIRNPKTDDENSRKYAAFRQSSNTPVQGSAADLLAIAMRNIKRRLKAEGYYSTTKCVLQVHDEVVYETDEQNAEIVRNIVKEEMESAVKLRVPLVANVDVGKVWGDIK